MRVMGPSLSSDHKSHGAGARDAAVGGSQSVMPHRIDDSQCLPSVSLPIEKPTNPAAVQRPGRRSTRTLLPPEAMEVLSGPQTDVVRARRRASASRRVRPRRRGDLHHNGILTGSGYGMARAVTW